MSDRYSRLTLLASLAATSLAFAACGGDDSVSSSEIEEKAKTSLSKEVGQTPKSISCPSDLDAKEGEKETCTLTDNEGNTYDMTAEITSVDGDNVEFHFQVADQPNN
jgi:uncharacterized protein DUF4333